MQKLQNAYDSKINEDISKAAHYIKGACTNLGMDEATEILQNIESKPEEIEGKVVLEKLKSIFEEIKKRFKKRD